MLNDYLILVADPLTYQQPEGEGENPLAFFFVKVKALDNGTVINALLENDPDLIDGDRIIGKWNNEGTPLAPLDATILVQIMALGNQPSGHIASPPDIQHYMGWHRRKYGSLDNPTRGDFPDGETPVKLRASWEKGTVKVEAVDYLSSRDMLARTAVYETKNNTVPVPFTSINGVPTTILPRGKPREEWVEEEKAHTIVRIRGPEDADEGFLTMHPKHRVREGLSWTYNQPGEEEAPEPEVVTETV